MNTSQQPDRNLRTDLSKVVKQYTGHTRQDFISELVRVCGGYTAERVAAELRATMPSDDYPATDSCCIVHHKVVERLAELRTRAATKDGEEK